MERPGVVDVDCHRRDLEDLVLPAEDVFVRPESEPAVLGQAIPADARAGK